MRVNETESVRKEDICQSQQGGYYLCIRCLLRKIPVKNCRGDTQNRGKTRFRYTHLHPSDFVISRVSQSVLREQYATPEEIRANCIRLQQDKIALHNAAEPFPPRYAHEQDLRDEVAAATKGLGWRTRYCPFRLPLLWPRAAPVFPVKRTRKTKGSRDRSVCLNRPMSQI